SFFYYDFKRPLLDKLDYNNYTIEDERKLISTLKYTDVHVNLCSTMAVDGSIFNKPQIAPYYDQDKSLEPFLRNIYKQEHYRPIINSGVLNMADSKEKLVSLIAGALQNPNGFNTKCGNCVTEIATYADGKSTARVIAKMKTFF
ncbi:MAG TPA: hypothetical protein VHB48_00610, partial [Chitinophagaceae bacterium]|nr:hypothetical protein [Chitinophagaceae bacterium]